MRRTKASLWVLAATVTTVATLFLLPYTPKLAVHTARVELGELAVTTMLEGLVVNGSQQPCVALSAGRIENVHVKKGQQVAAGELLFSMDTSVEEHTLAALSQAIFRQERALDSSPYADTVSALAAQSLMDAKAQSAQLRAQIELKQVRAAIDGVMGGVYVQPGDYVPEAAALGVVQGAGRRVTAMCRAADALDMLGGTPAKLTSAMGETLGYATLVSASAPAMSDLSGQYVQTLTLEPLEGQSLSRQQIGASVTVELLREAYSGVALAPVSAVGSGDTLWLMDNGRAVRVEVDVSARNADYVRVPHEYLGAAVILNPDEHALYADCPVKEAKRR